MPTSEWTIEAPTNLEFDEVTGLRVRLISGSVAVLATTGKPSLEVSSVEGDPLNVTDRYPITEGTFPIPISAPNDQFHCRLVNDSFLPSRWTTAQYNYTAAFLAQPQQGLGTNKS